jgi:predicted dehydrogenase
LKSLNFGLIGAGRIAHAHSTALEHFRAEGGLRIVGVVDPVHLAAQIFSKRLECRAFDVHTAMADSVSLDAVIICTPVSTHAPITRFFLERRIAVLCEKPLGLDIEQTRALISIAHVTGTPLMTSAKFRYADDVLTACHLLERGHIGQVIETEVTFTLAQNMSQNWRSIPSVSGGGVLIDKGPQAFDLLRLFLGSLHAVHATQSEGFVISEVENTVSVTVRNIDGVKGKARLSWLGENVSDVFASIKGTAGDIELGWASARHRLPGEPWTTFGKGYNQSQAFRAQLGAFIGAIRSESPVRLVNDLSSAVLVDAGYRSIRTGDWIDVD